MQSPPAIPVGYKCYFFPLFSNDGLIFSIPLAHSSSIRSINERSKKTKMFGTRADENRKTKQIKSARKQCVFEDQHYDHEIIPDCAIFQPQCQFATQCNFSRMKEDFASAGPRRFFTAAAGIARRTCNPCFTKLEMRPNYSILNGVKLKMK